MYTPRGGTTTEGSNAPGAFLVGYLTSCNEFSFFHSDLSLTRHIQQPFMFRGSTFGPRFLQGSHEVLVIKVWVIALYIILKQQGGLAFHGPSSHPLWLLNGYTTVIWKNSRNWLLNVWGFCGFPIFAISGLLNSRHRNILRTNLPVAEAKRKIIL